MLAKLATLIADGKRNEAGIAFKPEGIEFPAEVPVYLEQGETIANCVGKAKLSVHRGVLWAEVEMLDHRMVGSHLNILYPHPLGDVLKLNGTTGVVEKMKVRSIGMLINKPQDPRIGTLRQQGVKPRVKG